MTTRYRIKTDKGMQGGEFETPDQAFTWARSHINTFYVIAPCDIHGNEIVPTPVEPKQVTLTPEQIEELSYSIRSLQRYYIFNPYGSDYQCCYCLHHSPTNTEEIVHAPDCEGNKYLGWLEAHQTTDESCSTHDK